MARNHRNFVQHPDLSTSNQCSSLQIYHIISLMLIIDLLQVYSINSLRLVIICGLILSICLHISPKRMFTIFIFQIPFFINKYGL